MDVWSDVWSCERIFWELLPAVRKHIAIELRKRGKKVPEIAKVLGITKAAVSQYLKGKRGGDLEPWMKEIVKKYLKGDCIDVLLILNEIVHDPRFKGWKCG